MTAPVGDGKAPVGKAATTNAPGAITKMTGQSNHDAVAFGGALGVIDLTVRELRSDQLGAGSVRWACDAVHEGRAISTPTGNIVARTDFHPRDECHKLKSVELDANIDVVCVCRFGGAGQTKLPHVIRSRACKAA